MRNRLAIGVAGVLVLGAGLRGGMARLIAMPNDAPLKEVVAMVETWVKEHPTDANGYYTLGRVHAMGWAYGEKIPLLWGDRTQLPRFGEFYTIRMTRGGMNESEDLGFHRSSKVDPASSAGAAGPADWAELQASIEAYAKAVELDPNNALYEEGLAWMLQRKGEVGAAMADEVKDLTAAEREKFGEAIKQLGASDFPEREAGSTVLREAMPRSAGMLKGVKTEDVEVAARIAAVFRDYGDLQALPHYRRVYAHSVAADLKKENAMGADMLISADAADAMLAILAERPAAAEEGEVKAMAEAAEKLREKKQIQVFLSW